MTVRSAWESLQDRYPCTLETFEKSILGAEIHDVSIDGIPVGAIVVIGPEIHACIKQEGWGRWLNKKALHILGEVIKTHGFATTTVTAGNQVGDRFVKRMGFHLIETTDTCWKYRKD